MAVDIQTIEKGTMNWHIPMNENLEKIKAGFEAIDSQFGQYVVRTNAAAFFALTTDNIKAMYTAGTRLIFVSNTEYADFPYVPVTIYYVEESGTTRLASEMMPQNYAYEGKDLSTVFADAAALHAAVAAGDFSKISVGDYWPITLNGSYTDCGENTTKTFSNATVKLEVAGIDTYLNFGDNGITSHHLVMCSRDCLPNTTKWRSENTTWYDSSKTNPWLGSAIYATLNVGILPLVQATNIGPYIFAGPNGNGMRFLVEVKAASAANATGWEWQDRGRLFLPFEREVWGQGIWSELTWGANPALQWPIFSGSFRHVIKGLGNGGSRCDWWLASSRAGDASNACGVGGSGYASGGGAGGARGLALCFLLA